MGSCQVSVYSLSSQLLRYDSGQDTQELHHLWVFCPQRKEAGADSEQLGVLSFKERFFSSHMFFCSSSTQPQMVVSCKWGDGGFSWLREVTAMEI